MTARPELCVGAVTVHAEHLLLIQRGTEPERGLWSLPGGRVEFGETLSEALTREVREEAGIDVVCEHVIEWVERMADDYHFVIVDFLATALGQAEPLAGSDADEARWVPLWQVSEYELVDGLLDFLADHEVIKTL